MAVTEQLPSSILKQIQVLEPLCNRLKQMETLQGKLNYLKEEISSDQFKPNVSQFMVVNEVEGDFVLYALAAIQQIDTVFYHAEKASRNKEEFKKLVKLLIEIEQFYQPIGGVIGYHLAVLKLIKDKENEEKNVKYYKPEGVDLFKESDQATLAGRWGLEHLEEMAEIYPIGGAADRLQLVDEKSGEPLPCAELLFNGRTLLECLIRDVQAREYLFYKLYGRQLTTPIAMMTSLEKNNHDHILKLCRSHQWFGRLEENFKFFIQPLVPVITEKGDWVMTAPLCLLLKPGGHGVIWKAAQDAGVFDWFNKHRRHKALVRQINNPIAGVDNGLLALIGIGCEKNKDFGFASCFRHINASEGMNVLVEKKKPQGYEYCITNVEYTDFEKKGISDLPEREGSSYSLFPANTNILFVDLNAIQKALEICSIPGELINMKTRVKVIDAKGEIREIRAGRLESTMQNIADYIVDKTLNPLPEGQRADLRTFLTYNLRRKTISVTKETFKGKLPGTPEGCYYELLENYHDLLANYCLMAVPSLPDEKTYLEEGPSFIIDFHPALGGIFSVIAQKIRGGVLAPKAEWVMEIAESQVENLNLNGSLQVIAKQVLGEMDAQGKLVFGPHCGKCILKDVTVENDGIDWDASNIFWKRTIDRKESLQIILHGNAEFLAEKVFFKGGQTIEVPDGYRMTAYNEGEEGKTLFKTERISSPSWKWEYQFGMNGQITISIKSN